MPNPTRQHSKRYYYITYIVQLGSGSTGEGGWALQEMSVLLYCVLIKKYLNKQSIKKNRLCPHSGLVHSCSQYSAAPICCFSESTNVYRQSLYCSTALCQLLIAALYSWTLLYHNPLPDVSLKPHMDMYRLSVGMRPVYIIISAALPPCSTLAN